MEKTLFLSQLAEELQKHFSSDGNITITSNDTNEIQVSNKENGINHVINMDAPYQVYLQTNNFEETVNKMEEVIRNLISETSKNLESWISVLTYVQNFNNVRNHIFYSLIYDQTLPDEIIHERYLDTTKIYHIYYEGNGVFINNYINVCKKHLKMWNITEEELKAIADQNTEQQPIQIKKLSELIKEELNIDDLEDDSYEDSYEVYMMRYLNSEYGATAMCNKPALKKFAEEKQEDIFIIPCSTHEVMLIVDNEKDEDTALQLEDMLYGINSDRGIYDDSILSDSIYIYKRDTDTIEIV
ncbi:MAG: DUF5688 family protein [Lachnospiraceae bacterium]|nr:DUF5688 family protein [Lachnospiraceae bacterium]